MSKEMEHALSQVNEERRGFLKKLLIGSAAMAVLPLITSSVVAQDGGDDEGKGKGKKGKKGKKGDGKGKGEGEGQ